MFHSHLSYSILAWGNASKNVLKKTTLLQKRALRTINKSKYNSHTDPLYVKSDLLKLSDMYILNVCHFMHDYSSQKLPKSFQNCYKLNCEVHQERLTRQSSLFHISKSENEFASKLSVFIYPKIWNEHASQYSDATKTTLKQNIKSSMLAKYPRNVKCSNNKCSDCFNR